MLCAASAAGTRELIVELQEVLRENPDDTEATKALYVALETARAGGSAENSPEKMSPAVK